MQWLNAIGPAKANYNPMYKNCLCMCMHSYVLNSCMQKSYMHNIISTIVAIATAI